MRRRRSRQVGMLSGGERNRCHLAKMVKRGNNLIMVRPPSNAPKLPLQSSADELNYSRENAHSPASTVTQLCVSGGSRA
jgi:hypothetical protein